MAQEDFAVVVGITMYPGFKNLDGPENDAQEFIDWLKAPNKGDVPDAHIARRLTSHDHPPLPNTADDAHPWEDELNQLFKVHVQNAALGKRIGRRLYIYAAGHGFADPTDMSTAAIYAANAEDLFPPHVTATAYANFFRQAAAFDEIVLIMDCCRTTSSLQSVRNPPVPNLAPRAGAKNVRMFTAFGASFGSPAREKVFGAKSRGIFTMALMEALERCDPDPHGNVTGQLIKNYIHNRIDALASPVKVDPPEIPIASRDITFLVRQNTPLTNITFAIPADAVGHDLVIDQSPIEVHREPVQGATAQVPLKPGLYKARVDATNRQVLFEVAGEEITVVL